MAPAVEALLCGNCGDPIPPEYWNAAEEVTCRGCLERLLVRTYPALARGASPNRIDGVEAEGEASCFYHPVNRAVLPCERCGRFLCALCDLDLDGRHLCPRCLHHGVAVEKAPSLDERRVQYDSMALHLSTWPVLTLWLPIITAPVALFLVVRHWRTPMTILPRTRVRLWLALVLSTLEMLALTALIVFLIWFVPQARTR